jgi:glycosyltransferase involved in cell wall biosynthesis
MPSRFEGLGLLAIEALMAGTPVAVTDARGLDEAVPPGYPLSARVDDVDGLGSVVADMIDRSEAMRELVAPMRADLVERFSPQTMARAYDDAYLALAERT